MSIFSLEKNSLEKKLFPKEGSREYLVLRSLQSSLITKWCSALVSPMTSQKKRLQIILKNIKGTVVGRDYDLHYLHKRLHKQVLRLVNLDVEKKMCNDGICLETVIWL